MFSMCSNSFLVVVSLFWVDKMFVLVYGIVREQINSENS